MSVFSKVKATVVRFERTPLAAQLFRVARLTAVGVATAYVTGSAVDTTLVVAAAEAAFRQVFPA